MLIKQQRVDRLVEYIERLHKKQDSRKLYDEYLDEIASVLPQETFGVFTQLLQIGHQPHEILKFLDKIINVFYKSLSAYPAVSFEENSFLEHLQQENQALIKKMEAIKEGIKNLEYRTNQAIFSKRIAELSLFEAHYQKKENIL